MESLEKNSNNSNKRNDLIYQSKNNKISSYAEQNKNRKNSKSDIAIILHSDFDYGY